MPQNVDIPEPVTSVATDKQIVKGSDGRRYVFSKKMPAERIDKYFKQKGLTRQDTTSPVHSLPVNPLQQSGLAGLPTSLVEQGAAALPSVGGMAGGVGAGTPGAGLGGLIGEDLRQMIMRPILLGRGQQDLSVSQSLVEMGKEAVGQAALEYTGKKAGEVFFNTLNKVIPHATIKGGIPLLPGDLNPNSKVMRYVEDLLTNLAPSSKTMAEFESKQSAAILSNAKTIAEGFSKFKGTPEEMGVLLQKTLSDSQKNILKGLKQIKEGYIKGGASAKQADLYLKQSKVYKDYVQKYENELVSKIVGTNKPELIAGLIRGSKSALNENRILNQTLKELKPELLGNVRNVLARDIINVMAYGSKDPAMQVMAGRGMGKSLKNVLNDFGDQKLKAVFGETGYKSLTEFSDLIKYVDRTQGNGAGKFLNLLFILPFRGGATVKAGVRTATLGLVFNRAAKIITNPEGVKIYEGYIRAAAAQSPRLLNLAREEIKAFNERSDAEYEQEEKQVEEEFRKQHGGK